MSTPMLLIWIVAIFGFFYLFLIRPQRRQQQQHTSLISSLKRGDRVVTIGGVMGTVSAIGDDWVELEIARNTRVRYLKRAINSLTSAGEEDEEDYDEQEYLDEADEEYDEEYVETDVETLEDDESLEGAEVVEADEVEVDGEPVEDLDEPQTPKA